MSKVETQSVHVAQQGSCVKWNVIAAESLKLMRLRLSAQSYATLNFEEVTGQEFCEILNQIFSEILYSLQRVPV